MNVMKIKILLAQNTPEVLSKLPMLTVLMTSSIFAQIWRELLFCFTVLLNFMLLGLTQLTLTCSNANIEICSKLTIKTLERRLEHITHLF